METDNSSTISTHPTKAMTIDMATLSPLNRMTVKTALTPMTEQSSTPISHASTDSSCAHRSETGSLERSCVSTRIPIPSPSRSRLDRRYAKRLAVSTNIANASSTSPLGPSPNSSGARLFLPPGIPRDASIFQPTPILSIATPTSSSSSIHMSPRQHFFPSSREDPIDISPTARYTTSIRSAADIGTSDRFIPSRAVSNMNNDLWGSVRQRDVNSFSGPVEGNSNEAQSTNNSQDDSATSPTNGANSRMGDMTSPQPNLHNILLRSELLGENMSPYANNFSWNGQPRIPGQTTPLRDGANQLRFQSPRQAYQENIFNELTGPTSVVNSFSLTPVGSSAGHRLMSAPQKRRRRIAKVPFKVLDAPALQDDFYLNLVDWSSQNVLAVGLGSCVYLWSACTSKVTKLCDLTQTDDLVTSVSWAQRGTHLAVGTNKGEVQLWDTINVKKVRTMTGHSARVGTLAWTGPTLASGGRDRLIFLRDVRAQEPFANRLTAHKQEVCGLKWSFDEPSFLASGGNDNQLHVVDSRNPGSPLHRFSDHTAAVKAIAWSPHQHGLLASGGGTADRCIRFWNTLSGTCLNTVDTGSQVCNLAWSQNCNEIVSTHGYSLNQIVVWRYPSLSKVVTLTGHTFRVLYLALSPDGSTIVTGAGDETLRFWQVFPGPRSDGKSNAGSLLFPNTLGSVIR